MRWAAGAALATAGLLWSATSAAGSSSFDLLYLKSNVGESAGGHSAIRFDDDVYHFQNDAGGLLRLRRTPDRRFRWAYAVLQNRSIRVARVAAPPDARARLRDAFNQRFLLHETHGRVLETHARDGALLDALVGATEGHAFDFPVPGAGLFAAAAADPDAAPPALAILRDRIDARWGPTFRDERGTALHAALASLDTHAPATPVVVDKQQHPEPPLRPSERYDLLAQRIVALDVLAQPRPLAAGILRDAPAVPNLALSPALRRQLTRFADRTADRLVALVASDDATWGFPVLLGMARLVAIDASLTSGRLLVLDGFPTHARTLDDATVARRHAFVEELAVEAKARFADRRARFVSADPPGERELRALEAAANRWIELWRGASRGTPVRTSVEPLLPDRAATVPTLPVPERSPATLREDRAAAARTHAAYVDALEHVFGYHLFRANCATEIFALIESTLGATGTAEALGGRVSPTGGMHFVPGLAHRAALRHWNVAATGEVPSFRRAQVGRMYRDEPAAAAYLRESNRLTSTLYRQNDADAPFLFFTDDAAPARPLLGIANLVVGTGHTLWGTLRAPFDAGAAFRAGVSSIVFSLPELFWVNIRKGTFEYGLDHVDVLGRGIDGARPDAADANRVAGLGPVG